MKKLLLFLVLFVTAFSLTSCTKECVINYDGKSTTITLNETFELPQMEKDGYIFLGWYKDESFTDGSYETFIPTTTEEVSFYAKWIDVDTFEANKIIDLINELKDIKLSDESKINDIKTKYDSLSDVQKNKVNNYNLLEQALLKIEQLKEEQKAVDAVIAAINSLPNEVTLKDETLVQEVNVLYNELNDNQKNAVTNYSVLEQALNTIQEIKNNIDLLISNLLSAIESLPDTLTLDDEENINNLLEQFSSLTDEQKTKITNYEKLLKAVNKIKELKQNEADKAEAVKMDEIINTLPDNITLDDEQEVLRIKAIYDQLTVNQKIKVTTYSKLKKALETIEHIKKQNETLEKVIKAIDALPEEITMQDEGKVHHANALYIVLDEEYQKRVPNYSKLEKALDIIRTFDEDVKNVVSKINLIPSKLTLDDKDQVIEVLALYNALTDDQKNIVTNYDLLEEALETLVILQEEYDQIVGAGKKFDTKIAALPSKITYIDKQDVNKLLDEYNGLDEEVKKHVSLLDKLNNAKKVIDDIEKDVDNITYVLGENVYSSKDELYESFFSDYYWFIYGYYGEEALTSKGVYDVDDFLTLGRTPGTQSTKYRALADTFSYFLTKDVNGLKENQPESTFIGYCMKNNLYEEIIDFFIMFFAYWRIDEGYANQSNYGADFFAEGWAPQVDICKFFNYTEETREVPKTSRVLDCFKSIEGVATGKLSTSIYEGMTLNTNLIRRGYTFAGWYDNPTFKGEPITEITKTGEKVILYAKWTEKTNIQDSDNASLVDIYIYNLTTSRANLNKTTVSITRQMYNSLTDNAKKMVKNYNTLTNLENKYK